TRFCAAKCDRSSVCIVALFERADNGDSGRQPSSAIASKQGSPRPASRQLCKNEFVSRRDLGHHDLIELKVRVPNSLIRLSLPLSELSIFGEPDAVDGKTNHDGRMHPYCRDEEHGSPHHIWPKLGSLSSRFVRRYERGDRSFEALDVPMAFCQACLHLVYG